MDTPLIVVNFKAYEESDGERGIALAKACEQVAEETGVAIVACPTPVMLGRIANEMTSPVWAQHVDAVNPGGQTGHVTAQSVRSAGAVGTIINHSERRMRLADIGSVVTTCKDLDLVTCVCTNTTDVSRAAAAFSPDYVAIEPPELIGGDISVTTADPGIVSTTVELVEAIDPSVDVLCGAGVKNADDVKKAMELGARGVLLASGVVKSSDPKRTLTDLASAI